jgi:hypothetical protein
MHLRHGDFVQPMEVSDPEKILKWSSFFIRISYSVKPYNITQMFVQSSIPDFFFVLSNRRYDRDRWGNDSSVISRGRHVATTPGPVDVDVLVGLKLGVLLSG